MTVFDAGASAKQKQNFLASSGELSLGSPVSSLGKIGGFTDSDSIDLMKTAVTKPTYASGVLTVLNGTATVAKLAFGGTYTNTNFVRGSDNKEGEPISWQS